MILGVIFAGFLVVIFGYGVYEAREFPRLARLFPYGISLVILVLAVAQLGIEIRKYMLRTEDVQADFADLAPDRSLPPETVYKRAFIYLLWFVVLYALIWVAGFVIAITSFLLAFLKLEAKLSWQSALVLTAAGFFFVVGISWMMSLFWPDGLVTGWLGLPWPLT